MADPEGETRVPDKKITGKIGKYKWYIVGGLAVVAVLVFYFTRSGSSSSAGTTSGTANPGVDPSTGAGIPLSVGPMGPAGPPGQRGPRGKRGKRGKPGKNAKPPAISTHSPGNHPGLISVRDTSITASSSAVNNHNARILPAANQRNRPAA